MIYNLRIHTLTKYIKSTKQSYNIPIYRRESSRNVFLPIKYDRSIARSTETPTAHRAVHFQLQYFEDFLNLKALLDRVFLGSGRVGGEYTEPEAIVYPGVVALKRGVVPVPVLNRKCLRDRKKISL